MPKRFNGIVYRNTQGFLMVSKRGCMSQPSWTVFALLTLFSVQMTWSQKDHELCCSLTDYLRNDLGVDIKS